MKHTLRFICVGLFLAVAIGACGGQSSRVSHPDPLVIPDPGEPIPEGVSVTDVHLDPTNVIHDNAKRLGINIGGFNYWRARNLISNPGFEAGLFGTNFLAEPNSTSSDFYAKFWSGQPNGFWDGADYEIVFGPAAGESGTVNSFVDTGSGYAFDLSSTSGVTLDEYDVLTVRRDVPGYRGNPARASSDTRPGSPGEQSLILEHGDNFNYYMDAFYRDRDNSPDKLFIVQGEWRLRVWVKADPGVEFRVQFFRERDDTLGLNQHNFFNVTHTGTGSWELIDVATTVAPGDDPNTNYPSAFDASGSFQWAVRPILVFRMSVETTGESVLVDDVELFREDQATNPTAYNDKMIEYLQQLNPGVLRFWGSQLGESLDNQLAEDFARRTVNYRPNTDDPSRWTMGLHEFLELCDYVGAEPWYVCSPMMTDQEFIDLVEYLAAPATTGNPYAQLRADRGQSEPWTDVFATIHLEWGNELWGAGTPGDPFGGASVRHGTRLGTIASNRFAAMRTSPHFPSGDKLNLIIGGQAGSPSRQSQIEAAASEHDTVALAPYFGILNSWSNAEQMYAPLFASPYAWATEGRVKESWDHLQPAGTQLAIYEINYHTTGGSSPEAVRNEFVAGLSGALALPLSMLTYQKKLGAMVQTAFGFSQYSYRYYSGGNFHEHRNVRLWGMIRDLHSTGRKRPTWLGVELVNRAILETMIATNHVGDDPSWSQPAINGIADPLDVKFVHSFAYRNDDADEYAVVLFNLDRENPHGVVLQIPENVGTTVEHHFIAGDSLALWNEDSEEISIETNTYNNFADTYTITLPKHSIHVLRFSTE